MGCTDPSDGVEVYKLRDSPGPTKQTDQRAYVSVFDIARGQENVFGKGKYGAGGTLFVSMHPWRNLCVVPQTTTVDLPVPLSPLPPTPVFSPWPMSPAESVTELPELYFEISVAESVAKSLEPCSTEPRAASLQPEPHDPRSQEARPRDFKIHPRHIPAFGRRFLPSSWEEPRPKFFSTATGWRSLVAAMMTSRSRMASCPTLWTSGVPRPCRNVSPISTLVRSVSPMPYPRCNFGLFKTVYPPCTLGSASPS
ncbi:hypothetical protein NPIL_231031 [Nephila pilipes]|uniref:Uncharacterized protein n=1 Tax=Nephila pilipes TaxID=299642 RepID=A0A8X6R8V7_NEPPI|nr:hypothetical protein NPIL_231031 [Nephila pilipes]